MTLNSLAILFSSSVDLVAFCSKKVVFWDSYLEYVIVGIGVAVTFFVNVITSLKTFSVVSMSLGGSLLRKIEVNESIVPK